MAKEKLIPRPPEDVDEAPRERFVNLATKVFTVPKAAIDEREREWQIAHEKKKRPR